MDDAAAMRFVLCEEHWRQQLEGRRILREENPENELCAKKIWRERSACQELGMLVFVSLEAGILPTRRTFQKRACSFNDAQWYYFLATPFSISPSFKCINCIQVHPFHCNNNNNSNSRHYDCRNPIPPNATLAPSSTKRDNETRRRRHQHWIDASYLFLFQSVTTTTTTTTTTMFPSFLATSALDLVLNCASLWRGGGFGEKHK